jgi:transcriptional regulator GlxA family with amidase domain
MNVLTVNLLLSTLIFWIAARIYLLPKLSELTPQTVLVPILLLHGDGVVLKCQTWLAENYERAEVVTEVTRVSGLPKRTFDRRFKSATGYSPLAYVQALRIEEAKQMLETGSAPVDAIGREVGYEDAASFRRLFRRLAGMPPGDYRRRFRIPRNIAEAAAPASPQGAHDRRGLL